MAEPLEDLLRSCTVRVLGGPMPGAGFFVAPGMVLTCYHVVGDDKDLTVHWDRDGQSPLEVPVLERVLTLTGTGPIPNLHGGYPDVAVLRVGPLADQPCVGIDVEWPRLEDDFQIFGYPTEGGSVQLTAARLTYRGPKGTRPNLYLDLKSDTVKPGMSGAAVLNTRSGAVCGVVVASKHTAQSDGALAIHWSAVETKLRQVLAANREFHRYDRRWNAAAAAGAPSVASPAVASPAVGWPSSAVVVPGIPAYRVPLDWRPGRAPCPVSDAYRVDLGAWLCLDRGASTCVVVARAGTALADALNKVERGPVRHGRALGPEFPEQVWHVVNVDADEHELRSLRGGSAMPALVVNWPAGGYDAAWLPSRQAGAAYERIREALPDAPVVLVVQAGEPADAIAAAAEIGRHLRSADRGRPVEVLTQVRPGDPDLPSPEPALPGDPDLVAHRLIATVTTLLQARSVPVRPYPADDGPRDAAADPQAVAVKIVDVLVRSSPWGDPAIEALALALIRDHASRYFVAVVRRHSAHRAGSARWASLHAAAEVDDYVDVWLEAAPEVGAPGQVPRSLRDSRLVEAVLLGLLRQRGAAEIGPWRDAARHRCEATWRVAQQVAGGKADADFFQSASAEVGLAAIRAAAGNPLLADLPAPEASAAWWAAVGRSPLTERTVATLADLGAPARWVAGLTADGDEPDPGLAEILQQMRTAMRPPLPRWRNDR